MPAVVPGFAVRRAAWAAVLHTNALFGTAESPAAPAVGHRWGGQSYTQSVSETARKLFQATYRFTLLLFVKTCVSGRVLGGSLRGVMELVTSGTLMPTPNNIAPPMSAKDVLLRQNPYNAMYNDRAGGFGLGAGDNRASATGPANWGSPLGVNRIRWDGKYIPGFAHQPGTNPFAWVESNPHASIERMKEIDRQERELQAMLLERKKGLCARVVLEPSPSFWRLPPALFSPARLLLQSRSLRRAEPGAHTSRISLAASGPISSGQAQEISRELYTGPAGQKRVSRMQQLEAKLGVDKVCTRTEAQASSDAHVAPLTPNPPRTQRPHRYRLRCGVHAGPVDCAHRWCSTRWACTAIHPPSSSTTARSTPDPSCATLARSLLRQRRARPSSPLRRSLGLSRGQGSGARPSSPLSSPLRRGLGLSA